MLTKTDLFELLSIKNKDFQIHDHDPLFTVEDSENLRGEIKGCLLYTSPSPRDQRGSGMAGCG